MQIYSDWVIISSGVKNNTDQIFIVADHLNKAKDFHLKASEIQKQLIEPHLTF